MTTPNLVSRVAADLALAMKAKDAERLSALRMAKTTLTNAAIDARARGAELSEADATAALQTHAKRIRESIAEYRDGGREDLATAAERELLIITAYLPQQLSAEEIRSVVSATRAATGLSAVGPLMGAVMRELQGQADGNTVRAIVTEELQRTT